MQNVVLDALIQREDFEIASDIGNRGNTTSVTKKLAHYKRTHGCFRDCIGNRIWYTQAA